MTIYVVRHGQTNTNHKNLINGLNNESLNQTGISQAKQLAKKIKTIDYHLLISSPVTRAVETAKIIDYKNIIQFDERLKERDAGKLMYQPMSTLNQKDWFDKQLQTTDYEPFQAVINRTIDFLNDLPKEKTIIIVTHGSICEIINLYFNKLDYSKNRFYQKNCQIIEYKL